MVRVVAIAALIAFSSVNDPSDKPVGPQRYKPDLLIADLKSDDRADNDRALSFLFDLAASFKCDQLGQRKKHVAEALIPWLDNVEERKNVLLILGRIGPDSKAAVPSIVRFIKRVHPTFQWVNLSA